MLFRWYLIIHVIFLYKIEKFKTQNYETFNDAPLRKLLNKQENVQVLLRSNYIQKDSINPAVQWTLRSSNTPVKVFTYDPSVFPLSANLPRLEKTIFIIVSELKYMDKIVEHFVQPRGSFIFVFNEVIFVTRNDNLRQIFDRMWRERSVVITCIMSPEGSFYYDPLSSAHMSGTYGQFLNFTGEKSIFYLIFHDMRGYPLRIQSFYGVFSTPVYDEKTGLVKYIDGMDGEVLRVLKEILNFTIILREPSTEYYGERSENGTFNGALGQLLRGEIDAIFTGYFIKDYRACNIDFSFPVYEDQLCVYTAKARTVPLSILPIYTMGTHLPMFLVFGFIYAFVWIILSYIHIRMEYSRKPKNMFLHFLYIFNDTFVIWVRRQVTHYPSNNSERMLVAAIALCSVIYGVLFESGLATAYIEPLYYADIQNLQELDESGIHIYYKYASFADDLFFPEMSSLFSRLNSKMVYIGDSNFNVKEMIQKHPTTVASVTRFYSLNIDDLEEIVEKKFWIIPECPKYYSLAYVYPKDSPFRAALDFQLSHITSSGFFVYWREKMRFNAISKLAVKKNKRDVPQNQVLDINDLQLSIFALFCGALVSTLVFLGEILYFRYTKRKSKKFTRN